MIPEDWTPVERDDDGELIGFLEPVADGVRPVSPFGYPVGEPGGEDEAIERLNELGLRYLAEPWILMREGTEHRVRFLEAGPARAVLQVFFTEGVYSGEKFVLTPPLGADVLTPERPLR
ncbi:MAG TPA: hypothetical protein VIL55_12880 [Naasia sp.]